ncbi:non-ribosomal peptide synthetase [Actinosynnema sp. NPDC059797]
MERAQYEHERGRGTSGLSELVWRHVRIRPDACAVRSPRTGESLTYRQLWARSGRLAADLALRGVGRGEVVAVDLGRSVDLVVALLGVVRAGGAYLPLDAHAPADRRAVLLEEAGARTTLTATDLRDAGADAGAGEDEGRGVDVRASGDDPCYVNFTSGSTGRPKGVLVPHRAVVRLVTNARYCTVEPGDRVANASNPAFDATTFELWHTLTAGATAVVFPAVTELRLDDWVELVRAEGITTMFLTTSLFHMVARERPGAFRGLRTVVVGGEQLDLAACLRVLAEDPPDRLVNGYGPTETTTFATYYDCTPDSLAGRDRVPVGFPLQDTPVHVLDADLRPVEPGATGELCVGGPGVALGYLNRPDLTRERFVPAPDGDGVVYRTGDLARALPDGALEVLGRRDRQVKLRGFRIELEEVERAVLATGLVDAAFVEKLGEGPSACLACAVLPGPDRGDPDALPAALGEALARSLPAYMAPTRWHVLSGLPYGPTGKVDRARLFEPFRSEFHGNAEKGVSTADAPASSTVTGQVELVWKEVLGVSTVEAQDNFLDAGGNSILAIQLASRLRERLAVDVEPTDVLLADSLAELADRVGERVAAKP